MSNVETFTLKQAAKLAGIGTGTFLKRAKALELTAYGKVESGKRGRPAGLWTKSQIAKLTK